MSRKYRALKTKPVVYPDTYKGPWKRTKEECKNPMCLVGYKTFKHIPTKNNIWRIVKKDSQLRKQFDEVYELSLFAVKKRIWVERSDYDNRSNWN